MSIQMEIKCVDFNQLPKYNVRAQYIPAGIAENVSANVKQYFNNYTYEENGGNGIFFLRISLRNCFLIINIFFWPVVLKNALRGYPLDGCRMKVPEKLQGIVYQEPLCPMDENAKRFFRAEGIFSEFIYWNYDREPSKNDALKQALEWNDFANVVSSTVAGDVLCLIIIIILLLTSRYIRCKLPVA